MSGTFCTREPLRRGTFFTPGCRSYLPDPDDDKFLQTALNREPDCLVSGDADLLALNPFPRVRILKPRNFLQLVRNAGDTMS